MFRLLLVNGKGEATSSTLRIRTLRDFPGLDGVSVHFRPVRNDLLFESAKFGGSLAYRILAGEGIVRSQLWVEYEVLGEHLNVIGRSGDLLFALALITSKWNIASGTQPIIAATGVLDPSGRVLGVDRAAEKVAAAVRDLGAMPNAVVFYPAADAAAIEAWRATTSIPPDLDLRPVAHLDEALAGLGYVLEKVYLRNPFRGLEHFDYEHHPIFFGRDREVRELVSQLLRREEAGAPGVLVEGPSGSGKSSFLRAGVLPALIDPRHQLEEIRLAIVRRPVSRDVRYAIWRPGLIAIGADELTIVRSILDCWATLAEWSRERACAAQSLTQLSQSRREHWPSTMRFVWVIDQFEEIFNLGLDDAVLEHFGSLLTQLQLQGGWTLASIRSDAMPEVKRHEALRSVFGANEGQFYLATLQGPALDEVINLPAKAADLSFGIGPNGSRLDQLLREEAYREQDNLPLLQFTLNELFLKRSGSELTYAAYEQLGGLSGSVATTAQAILKAETDDSKRAVRRLFRSLVSVDEGGRATRRYAPIAELDQDPAQKKLLTRLVEARLCVTDQRDGGSVVAFAHDSLLRTLPVLTEWLKEEAALLQTRELAQREARQWQQRGQSVAWLAGSDKLVTFKGLDAAEITLPSEVRSFIDRSQRQARRTSLMRQAAVLLIGLLAVSASISAWVASKKQREAEYQTAQTLQAQARLLTEVAAQRLSKGDVAGASSIILRVLPNYQFSDAVNVFQESRAMQSSIAVLSGHTDLLKSVAYSPDGSQILSASDDHTARIWDSRSGVLLAVLGGHKDIVFSANYAPDGSRIVTASKDKTARVWDARTGAALAVLSSHTNTVYAANFSPDGARIVTASFDNTARIWDTYTGTELHVLAGHSDHVESAAYSPNGRVIVTCSRDATAKTWDAGTGLLLATLSGHKDTVWKAFFSPDGAHIVTASKDGTVRIWDAATGRPISILSGHIDNVFSARYSPDGSRIATAGSDKTVRIWNASTGVEMTVLRGHTDGVADLVFSPDGRQLLSGSYDNTARLWDTNTGKLLGVFAGHEDAVTGVAFSPNGSRISTGSADHTVRIWDSGLINETTLLSNHKSIVMSASFSPDDTRIVTASYDHTARVWDAHSGDQLEELVGHTDWVNSASYSPDGLHVVTASTDHTARIWDSRTGKQDAKLRGHKDIVLSAAYSRDGLHIVTASADRSARIWDTRTGAELNILVGHDDALQSAEYSPDGTRIVTTSADKTARIWDARTGSQLIKLSGHNDEVITASYSPDGNRIVTASADKTARIWDARTGAQLMLLAGHEDKVETAEFSPDGVHVLTAGDDKTVRIWDATTGTQLAVLVGHTDKVESASYSHNGLHIVSASDDKTARVRKTPELPAIAQQILWTEATETKVLSDFELDQLGLPKRINSVGVHGTDCDRAAGAIYDPLRRAPGVEQQSIAGDLAYSACMREIAKSKNDGRAIYQLGRALLAKRDQSGAQRQFERAIAEGYTAAAVDFGTLLVAKGGLLFVHQAIANYERAWNDGISFAAYELGQYYEHSVMSGADRERDASIAWAWYQKGAEVGEPHSLARIAERDELKALSMAPAEANALLLQAFSLYATAAGQAGNEAWPDDAWRGWRYRRAALARVLANEGMMQQVADSYAATTKALVTLR